MRTEIENWQRLLFSEEEDNRALALALLPNFDFAEVANALAISYLKLCYIGNSWAATCDMKIITGYFNSQKIDIETVFIFTEMPMFFDGLETSGAYWSKWIDTHYEATAAYFSKAQLLALAARHIDWGLSELCLRADWHRLISIADWRAALAVCTRDQILTLANMRTLERLPEPIFECIELRGLRIYAPLLSFSVGLLYKLKDLEALHLYRANLQGLDIDLRRLPKLRALTFRSKQKLLKLNIEGREQLESLDLFGNPVMRLPLWIWDLTSLQTLNIGGMNFSSFPPAVLALKNLEELYLTETRFTSLPDAFAALQNLRHLDISGGHFSRLPDFFPDLQQLEYLNLSRCNFKEIPSILAAMPALRELDIADNFIRKLDMANLRLLFARLTRLNVRAAISTAELLADLQTLASAFPKLRLEIT